MKTNKDEREEGERERHATWLELFYDLVFVVTISQLAHYLEENLSLYGFLQFVLLFIPVWWAFGWDLRFLLIGFILKI